MKREFRITKDGSHSIYLPEMDEQYHSHHGSIVEAKKVYLEYGLHEIAKSRKKIRIFEMGFGTGLNALLTMIDAKLLDLKVHYYCLEKYPIDEAEVEILNYSSELRVDTELMQKLHLAEWEKSIELDDNFTLCKMQDDLRSIELPKDLDLIYFDAFAPEKQPHLWTKDLFEKLYSALKSEGILTTYCVKGDVRRTLQSVGFKIEKLAGPEGGKREVLRARKNEL
jgi:tRNA U34 5-methylaminomethyl-2-thiouridine-forming methyltransferase MnmC